MKPVRNALWVAGSYLALGSLWIFAGNRWVQHLAGSVDQLARVEAYKGLLFVGITAALLFGVSLALFRATAREAEARLRRRETLLRLDREVLAGLLRWSVAHDLRNVLTLVVGSADQLRSRARTDPTLAPLVADLDTAAATGLALAERIVGPPEEAAADTLVRVDLRAVARDAEEAVGWHLALKRTQRRILDRGPVPVTGRPAVLRHALAHLLLQAGQASEGRGRIEVRVGAGGRDAWVEVHHDGRAPGGEAADPSQMGLVLAREAAEAHHGHLEVRPSELGGACYRMILPRATESRAPDPPETEPRP